MIFGLRKGSWLIMIGFDLGIGLCEMLEISLLICVEFNEDGVVNEF